MTTRTFPSVKPTSSSWEFISNSRRFESINGGFQTVQRSGQRWYVTLQFRNKDASERAALQAFIAQVNGLADNFTLYDHSYTRRGVGGGTPLVAGASQTGNSLNVDGCPNSTAGWLLAGDQFEVQGELKMVLEDVDTSGTGTATVTFAPELRSAPADNAPLTLDTPTGIFRFANPRNGWDTRPAIFSDFAIEAVEDVLA